MTLSTALAGVAGVLGLAIVSVAAGHGLGEATARGAVALALAFLLIGAALLGLGRGLESLVDEPPDGADP